MKDKEQAMKDLYYGRLTLDSYVKVIQDGQELKYYYIEETTNNYTNLCKLICLFI